MGAQGGAGLAVLPGLVIPEGELQVEAAHSGGPGGQNVNKVATKVVLRFDLLGSRTLSEVQRARLRERLGPRLTRSGEIVLHASRFRERPRNLEDARQRLAELLREALRTPRRRRATRPTRSSVRRRLEHKRRRGETKRRRRSGDSGGE